MGRPPPLAAALAALAMLGAVTCGHAAPMYTVIDLGTLGGPSSEGGRLNDAGYVAGTSLLPGGSVRHAFLWSSNDGMQDLGTLGNSNSNSYIHALNESNQVVGETLAQNSLAPRAALWHQGALTDLGTLPVNPNFSGNTATAYGINDHGVVVGTSNNHAFRWTAATGMTDLGTLGGMALNIGSAAAAINNAGVITGGSWTGVSTGQNHAFVYEPGTGFTDLGTLGGFYSYGNDINELGMIVGVSLLADNIGTGAFCWTHAEGMTDLGSLGGISTQAAAINDRGAIVGFSTLPGAYQQRAFVWTQQEGLLDLNALVGLDAGWLLQSASDINERGWITGTGTIDGETHAYLLLPLSSSGTLGLIFLGAVTAARCRSCCGKRS